MKPKKFDRSLGTSKRDQGIKTSKDPNPRLSKEGKKRAWKYMLSKSGLMVVKPNKPDTKAQALKKKVTGGLKRAVKALKHATE